MLTQQETTEEYEEVPTELTNGQTLAEETVAPNRYRWFKFLIEGKDDDIADIRIDRVLHAAAINLYVNFPNNDYYPTAEEHDWNPTLGVLTGSPGEYKISVQGVASYIEKDVTYLVSPDSNWATFDLSVEWNIWDEETKAKNESIRRQYEHEKMSSVWSSGYNKEVAAKYVEQQQEYEAELQQREAALQEERDFQSLLPADAPLTKEFKIGALVGQGAFSAVYRATDSQGQARALKIVDKEEASVAGLGPAVESQGQILETLQHPQLPKFYRRENFPAAAVLVTELAEGGELLPHLAKASNYTEDVVRQIIKQVLGVLDYLHQKSIVHQSLLPENILVGTASPLTVKLAGFTLAMVTKEDQEQGVSGGDPAFLAPELISQEPYGRKVDIWSVGVLTYLLLSGHLPFEDANPIRLQSKIRAGDVTFGKEWEALSEAQQFVRALLAPSAETRPSAVEALALPWLSAAAATPLPAVPARLAAFLTG